MSISVLIADDEPHARRYLTNLLRKDNSIGVVLECKNGQEVLNFLKVKKPNIIFLDINMPGLSGIEVAEQIELSETLLIFSTAYDQYALQAFEVRAFDYLVKPYSDKRFFEVLERAKLVVERFRQAVFSQKFTSLYREYNQSVSPYLSELIIKEKGFEKAVLVENILYIEASSIYAVLHLENGTVLYRAALNLLEQQLSQNFIRIHRSFIINSDYVTNIRYLNNNTYMLTMKNNDTIISSRNYKDIISKSFS